MEKVIVIGANHAGVHAILTMAENYSETVQIVAYDKNTSISFLGAGMALWLSDVVEDPEELFYMTPEVLRTKGVHIHMSHELEKIDFDQKKVYVKDTLSQEAKEDTYDKLILAVGSWPIEPNLEGIHLENVMYAKNFKTAEALMEKLEDQNIKKVAVVGAGYIGVELAEAFKEKGRDVLMISDQNVLSNYYDPEFQDLMKERLEQHGIELALGGKLTAIKGKDGKVSGVETANGGSFAVDMALLSIGFRANTDVLKNTGLAMNENGTIKVNNHQETNIKGVYAIGDCADIQNNAVEKRGHIALATNAVRTGIVAGHNAAGTGIEMQGVQGSNAIHIFGLTMCSTGLTERDALAAGFDCNSITVTEWLKPLFMPDNHQVTLKVVWDKVSRRILGAQMASDDDITLALHLFSMAVQEHYSIDKLALLDLFFLPHFNQPANFITKAGLLALGK